MAAPNISYQTSLKRQLSDANTDGTVMGQSVTDPISFYGAAPTAQTTPSGNVHTVAAGSVTSVFVNTTFDGSIGSTAFTVGDIVAALKTLGLLKT